VKTPDILNSKPNARFPLLISWRRICTSQSPCDVMRSC